MTAAERAMERARGGTGSGMGGGEVQRGPQRAPDPFATEVERALADVRAALGTDSARNRAPLFGVDAALLLGEEFPETQWQVTG